jgi:hypothetical protein
MSLLLIGTEGFEFTRRAVGPSRPTGLLSKVSRAGELLIVVDHYEVCFADGSSETIYLESLQRVLGLGSDPDRGFAYAEGLDSEPGDLLDALFETEARQRAGALRAKFAARSPVQIQVVANLVYRLDQEDGWEPMLAYLNSKLPEDAALTLEEMESFDVEAMIAFDPANDQPERADGTGFVMFFLENDAEDDGLPLLGLCILAHAVVNDLELMDVEEEPIYWQVIWRAEGGA